MTRHRVRLYCRAAGREFKESLWVRYDPRLPADFCIVYPSASQERRERRDRVRQFGVVQGNVIISKAKLDERILAQSSCLNIKEEELAAFLSILLRRGEGAPQLRESLCQVLGPKWGEKELQRVPLGVLRRLVEEMRALYVEAKSGRTVGSGEAVSALQSVTTQLRRLLEQRRVQYSGFALVDYWSNASPCDVERLFPGVRHIILDGFLSFDAADYAMIDFFRRLGKSADEVSSPLLHVLFDFEPETEKEMSPHFAELWERLRREHVAEEVICSRQNSAQNSGERFAALRVFPCRDREEEARAIARFVRETIQNGVRPDRIGICFSHPELYAEHLRRAFRESGLAYRIFPTVPLAGSALWTFVVTLAYAIGNRGDDGIPLWAIDSLVKNPWFRYASAPMGYRFLHHYRWLRSQCPEAGTVEELLAAPLSAKYFSESEEDDEQFVSMEERARDQERRREARESVGKALEWLEQFAGSRSVEEWAQLLKSVLGRLLAAAADSTTYLRVDRLDDFRHATAAIAQLLNIAYRVRDTFSALLPEVRLDFPTYVETLSLLGEKTRVADHIRSEQGVEILTPKECLGARFDVLVWGGLLEGEFPHLPALSWRDGVQAKGVEEILHQISVQRYVFHSLLRSAQTVYLSYPQFSDGLEVLRSRFLDEILPALGEAHKAPGDDDVSTWRDSVMQRWKELATTLILGRGEGKELAWDPASLNCDVTNVAWFSALSEYCQQRTLTNFEGSLVGDSALLSEVAAFLQGKVFSASELSILFKCPLRYFIERVLGIKPPSPPRFEEMAQYGQLVHSILCTFMKEMRAVNYQPLLHGDRDELQAVMVRTTLQELAERNQWSSVRRLALALRLLGTEALGLLVQEPSRLAEALSEFVSVPAVACLLANSPESTGVLTRFLNCELARWQSGEVRSVALLEWQFGMPSGYGEIPTDDIRLLQPEPVDIGHPDRPLLLRGRIDRVDLLYDNSCYLIDYKTRKRLISRPQKLDTAVSNWIQLILYSKAVECAQPAGISMCSNVGYYQLADETSTLVGLNDKKSSCLQGYQEKIVAVLCNALNELATGRFVPYWMRKSCRLYVAPCPYFRTVCRGEADETLAAKVPECPWMENN